MLSEAWSTLTPITTPIEPPHALLPSARSQTETFPKPSPGRNAISMWPKRKDWSHICLDGEKLNPCPAAFRMFTNRENCSLYKMSAHNAGRPCGSSILSPSIGQYIQRGKQVTKRSAALRDLTDRDIESVRFTAATPTNHLKLVVMLVFGSVRCLTWTYPPRHPIEPPYALLPSARSQTVTFGSVDLIRREYPPAS